MNFSVINVCHKHPLEKMQQMKIGEFVIPFCKKCHNDKHLRFKPNPSCVIRMKDKKDVHNAVWAGKTKRTVGIAKHNRSIRMRESNKKYISHLNNVDVMGIQYSRKRNVC